MISLYDYILESLQINEAAFAAIDFGKHTYVEDVLRKIQNCQYNNENKKALTLGDKNDGKKSYIQFDLTTDIKNGINDFIKNVSDKTVSDFNDLFKECNVTVYNDKELKDIKEKNKKISELFGKKSFWGLIYKGDFSGKNSSGASFGQIFESLVCYLYNNYASYNNYNKDNKVSELVEKWTKHFNVDKTNPRYYAWVESSKYTVETICKQFNPTEYIAFHIDGQNLFENIVYNKNFQNIALIFRGKTGIQTIFNNQNLNNIYQGKYKDKWNAADIVLVQKTLDYESFIKDLHGNDEHYDGKAFNNKLISYSILSTDNEITKTPQIVPISLKFIDSVRKTIYININNNDFEDTKEIVKDIANISNIQIQFGQRYKENELSGNFIVDGDSADIQIRKQSSDNLSIEAKLSDNKFARGGKGISVIKDMLGIDKNDFYVTFNEDIDIYNYFKVNNFEVNLTEKEFNTLSENNDGTLKDRICFRGFIGLIHYYKHYKDKPIIPSSKFSTNIDYVMSAKPLTPSEVVEFIQFIWHACTQCPGVYYIIK